MSAKNLFDSAQLRLTSWYLLILVVLSLLFSTIVYTIASNEFDRAFRARPGEPRQLVYIQTLREERAKEGRANLVSNLVLFNLVVVGAGGAASYLLARRTLRPIEEALQAQSRFSSDAAHELRTPLAVMQSEIEVDLRDLKATKKSHRTVLESNLEEVHRLRVLTDRLLMLASSQSLPLSPVSLEQVAIAAVNHAVPLATQQKISIDNQVGDLRVTAHAESLGDVLTILIDNAIKYSPPKSTVTLTAEPLDGRVEISVKDNGVGIPLADQDKVFDRFYRVDDSRSRQNIEGYGLGLAIAKQLVEMQDGALSVKSQPGKGSSFTVSLASAQR